MLVLSFGRARFMLRMKLSKLPLQGGTPKLHLDDENPLPPRNPRFRS